MSEYLVTLMLVYLAGYAVGWMQAGLWALWRLCEAEASAGR